MGTNSVYLQIKQEISDKEKNFPITFSYFYHHLHLYISSITIRSDLRSFASGSLSYQTTFCQNNKIKDENY